MDKEVFKICLGDPRPTQTLLLLQQRMCIDTGYRKMVHDENFKFQLRNIRTIIQKCPPKATNFVHHADTFII